jgi:Ni/Co efflux regulator RcnB
MKRIVIAVLAGTLSLSALALGANQANAAELSARPAARNVEYVKKDFHRGHRRHVRFDKRHGRRARSLRMRRFHKGV